MGTIYNLPKFEPRRKSLSMSRHKPYCQCHWMSVCPLGRNDALSSPSSSEKSSDTSSEKSDSEKFSDRSGNDAVITVTEIILADEVEQKDSKEDGTSFATEAILAEELEQKDSKEDVTSTTKDSPKNAKQTQKNLKAPIYKLPTEILSEIISFLPASSLVTATRVAKFMNTAIHSYVESENAILAPGIMLPTHGVDKWRYVCDEAFRSRCPNFSKMQHKTKIRKGPVEHSCKVDGIVVRRPNNKTKETITVEIISQGNQHLGYLGKCWLRITTYNYCHEIVNTHIIEVPKVFEDFSLCTGYPSYGIRPSYPIRLLFSPTDSHMDDTDMRVPLLLYGSQEIENLNDDVIDQLTYYPCYFNLSTLEYEEYYPLDPVPFHDFTVPGGEFFRYVQMPYKDGKYVIAFGYYGRGDLWPTNADCGVEIRICDLLIGDVDQALGVIRVPMGKKALTFSRYYEQELVVEIEDQTHLLLPCEDLGPAKIHGRRVVGKQSYRLFFCPFGKRRKFRVGANGDWAKVRHEPSSASLCDPMNYCTDMDPVVWSTDITITCTQSGWDEPEDDFEISPVHCEEYPPIELVADSSFDLLKEFGPMYYTFIYDCCIIPSRRLIITSINVDAGGPKAPPLSFRSATHFGDLELIDSDPTTFDGLELIGSDPTTSINNWRQPEPEWRRFKVNPLKSICWVEKPDRRYSYLPVAESVVNCGNGWVVSQDRILFFGKKRVYGYERMADSRYGQEWACWRKVW